MSCITHHSGFELRFPSLFDVGRDYAFPCDEAGRVDIDKLGERERNSYFYARSCVGREFLMPTVRRRFGGDKAAFSQGQKRTSEFGHKS